MRHPTQGLADNLAFRALRWLRYSWRGGESRAVAALSLFRPPGLFQPFGDTKFDRYPAVFGFVRQDVGDGPERRILSFGCSTGEEVFSLRRYFPEAAIDGFDISADRIATCRRRWRREGSDPRTGFAVACAATEVPPDSYDAIFAMAVFRHGRLNASPRTCADLIRFADFERTAEGLARGLRPRGLLAIRHANFRFADTACAADFDVVLSLPAAGAPKYDRNDRLLPGEFVERVIFRKRSEKVEELAVRRSGALVASASEPRVITGRARMDEHRDF